MTNTELLMKKKKEIINYHGGFWDKSAEPKTNKQKTTGKLDNTYSIWYLRL